MKTERELQIDAYIEQHPHAKLKAPLKIAYHGKINEHDVFRLPISLLTFNISNGRFAAELLAEEKKIGRKLDVTKPDDIKIVRRLLLEQSIDETTVLTADLKKNGQLDPGIITFDGAVINANRRMSILQALHEESGDERFEYLNVARLPKGVDEKDLWKIEAKLQFGHDFRLDYGPVNELLKLRAGKHSGLSEKQISVALAGRFSDKEVGERLEVLKLMDSYLHFIEKPGEYRIIQDERAVEKFNSLHGNVIAPLKKGAHKSEVPKITEIAFGMIKTGDHSHWQIRDLKDIVQLDKARKNLYAVFDKKGKLSDAPDVFKDAFDAAKLIVDIQDEKNRPEKLAGKAVSFLQQIDSNHASVKKQAFQKLIAEVGVEAARLSKRKSKTSGKAGNQN